MPRSLSSAIQGVIGDSPSQTCHLLTFTIGATTYRFTDGDAIRHLGNTYTPRLILESGPRYSEKLQAEPVTVKLQNIDLATAKMLKAESDAIQGVEATLQRLFPRVREAVTLFVGRISE